MGGAGEGSCCPNASAITP